MLEIKEQISEKNAFSLGLPKWPQMRVTGKKISITRAKEIIFATDTFLIGYSGGNDKDWESTVKGLAGLQMFEFDPPDRDTATRETYAKLWEKRAKMRDLLAERAGFLSTTYVHNSWASCNYLYGPHGWCHPDGTIYYAENVGSWPSVEEIAEDWKKIAARWPFLDLWVTLFNAEHCEEGAPVVSMRIKEGKVLYFEGRELQDHDDPRVYPHLLAHQAFSIGDMRREHGLPESWIQEFAAKMRPIVTEIARECAED